MSVPARSRTRNPMTEMPLGSVACTVRVSFASARTDTVCWICGGVTSFAADRIVTVMGDVCDTRPPESTAKPASVKNPVVPVTCTESTKSRVSGNGGDPLTSESPVCAV